MRISESLIKNIQDKYLSKLDQTDPTYPDNFRLIRNVYIVKYILESSDAESTGAEFVMPVQIEEIEKRFLDGEYYTAEEASEKARQIEREFDLSIE